MEIFYILSLIVLVICFLLQKKSNEKINFIKWLVISVVSIYSYNIFIGMLLGILNITANLWLLAIINICVSLAISYRLIRYHEMQKYNINKIEVIGLLVVLCICAVIFFKDLYIINGDVSHLAVDSAIHYRAAKHYSENLKIFINTEDKTFFNFNIMQTGAYINDGIFMRVINGITSLEHPYIYQLFETMTLFFSGITFYAIIADKIKNKKGLIASLCLVGLYIYGYPYNSWIYGFSYLSVGIVLTALLMLVVETIYSEEKINKVVAVTLVVLAGFGLIFSYCLFIPTVFAAICIYCFLKDLSNKETKKYLKFFGKNTLIVTGLLLLVTACGIGYLFIPSFFIEGQTNLVSALKIDGEIYDERYINFIPYIPFAILYFYEIIKRIKSKELRYQDVFTICVVGYTALLTIGIAAGLVSQYYMIKTYSILWLAVFVAIIDILNDKIDDKIFRMDVVILALMFAFLVFVKIVSSVRKGIPTSVESAIIPIAKIYAILLGVNTVLPEIVKHINLSKLKKLPEKLRKDFDFRNIKITPFLYVMVWTVFVCSWVWIKAGHVIGETEKHSLPNFVGIYFSENCDLRKGIDLNNNCNGNVIKLATYARENLEDMTVENTELLTESYYPRIWATAILEFSSDTIPYQNVVQDTTIYTVDDALADETKKYIIKLSRKELQELERYKVQLKQAKENEKIEILMENENGFVAKINR